MHACLRSSKEIDRAPLCLCIVKIDTALGNGMLGIMMIGAVNANLVLRSTTLLICKRALRGVRTTCMLISRCIKHAFVIAFNCGLCMRVSSSCHMMQSNAVFMCNLWTRNSHIAHHILPLRVWTGISSCFMCSLAGTLACGLVMSHRFGQSITLASLCLTNFLRLSCQPQHLMVLQG